MSFLGRLDQFQLTDLLQLVATNQKSGKLHLTKSDAEGLIVFREGEIVYATSSGARETLGHLLVCRGLITETQLLAALEVQHSENNERRLGTILIESAHLTLQDLELVLRVQLEKVLYGFLRWQEGFFNFEPIELIDQGEIGIDISDFLLKQGVNPDDVLEELSARLEEATEVELEPTGALTGTQRLIGLKALMREIRSPEFTGEVTSKLLEFGRGVFSRGVLFFSSQGNYVGMSHFGLGEDDGSQRKEIKIPKDQASILSQAANSHATKLGPLEPIEWNLYLVSHLGGEHPTEAAALPLVVNDETMLVLYGDNAGSGRPIGKLDDFELLLLQVGLAMEKQLLEKRLEQFEKLRRS